MRHKVLACLEAADDKRHLSDVIQASEIYFTLSFKDEIGEKVQGDPTPDPGTASKCPDFVVPSFCNMAVVADISSMILFRFCNINTSRILSQKNQPRAVGFLNSGGANSSRPQLSLWPPVTH